MWPEPFQNETALGSPSPLSPFFHPWEQCKPERRNPLLAVLRAQEKRDAYKGFRVGPMAFLRAWGNSRGNKSEAGLPEGIHPRQPFPTASPPGPKERFSFVGNLPRSHAGKNPLSPAG